LQGVRLGYTSAFPARLSTRLDVAVMYTFVFPVRNWQQSARDHIWMSEMMYWLPRSIWIHGYGSLKE